MLNLLASNLCIDLLSAHYKQRTAKMHLYNQSSQYEENRILNHQLTQLSI